jgi:DNA-binding GntR family transcriptional regulator
MPVSEVYCQLKQRILLGDLAPGESLQEHGLAKQFGVSRSPIREALIRLEADGLVRIVPKQGVFVTEVSHDTFKNAYEVRFYLIGMAGRLAAQRITDQELVELDAVVARLKEETDVKEIQALDLQFHDRVNCGTHNGLLAEALQRLRGFMPRVWVTTHADQEYFLRTAGEHEAILAALRDRNGANVASLLQAHIGRYREYVNDLPDLPAALM